MIGNHSVNLIESSKDVTKPTELVHGPHNEPEAKSSSIEPKSQMNTELAHLHSMKAYVQCMNFIHLRQEQLRHSIHPMCYWAKSTNETFKALSVLTIGKLLGLLKPVKEY